MKIFRVIFLTVLLTAGIFTYSAIGIVSPQRNLKRGIADFKQGRYQQALDLFVEVSELREGNDYREAALFLSAKTSIRLGDFEKALGFIRDLTAEFPQGIYGGMAGYLKAEALYGLNRDFQAYMALFGVLRDCSESEIKALAREKIALLIPQVNKSELIKLKRMLDSESRSFLDEVSGIQAGKNKILLLTSPADSMSAQIIEGMIFSLDIYKKETGNKYPVIEVIEMQGPALQQYFQVRDFALEPVQAVVCLGTGDEMLIQAAAGSWLDIPLFILNDDTPDLWKISDNIWQLHPDQRIMGTALAEYAVKGMHLHRFITMAPVDDSRVHFAEGFINKAEELEAEIAGQEWFYIHAEDLGRNFQALRRIGFRIAFDDSLTVLQEMDSLYFSLEKEYPIPDSLRIEVDSLSFKADTLSQELLDSLWMRHVQEAKELARFQRVEADSNDIPLSCFDGFVFPLEEEETDMYINQFAFYNLKTEMFSLAESFRPHILEKYRKHLDNLKVIDWSKRSRTNDAFYLLSDRYYAAYNRPPEDKEALGYDTMNFILNMMTDESGFSSMKREELSFRGANYDFVFPPGARCNHSVNFFEFNGWSFVPMPAIPPDTTVTGDDTD